MMPQDLNPSANKRGYIAQITDVALAALPALACNATR